MTCTEMYEKPKHFAKSLHRGDWPLNRDEIKGDFILPTMDLLSELNGLIFTWRQFAAVVF